jgi:hypothetical protein
MEYSAKSIEYNICRIGGMSRSLLKHFLQVHLLTPVRAICIMGSLRHLHVT